MKPGKILITGGAGFIGSNIADAYIEAGHRVIIVDNLSTGNRGNINRKAKFYKVDITDARRLEEVFRKERPEVVNHHAAQIDVRKSVADPTRDAGINVIGTLNLFENAKKYGINKVIFASSGGTIYGECGKNPPDEKTPGRPISPYGITKFTAEFYLNFYSQLFGMKYTVLRYANVYGPRQDPHGEAGVVAIFAERMLAGKQLNIFGDGRQQRDYVYVGDVVRANLRALARGNNETINIGTGRLTSVNQLFDTMAAIAGYGRKPVYQPARPGELMKSFLDNRKAARILGWKPEVPLEQGLENTFTFFKSRRKGYQ